MSPHPARLTSIAGLALLVSCGSPIFGTDDDATIRHVAPDVPTKLGFTAAEFATWTARQSRGYVDWEGRSSWGDFEWTTSGRPDATLTLRCDGPLAREIEKAETVELEIDCTAHLWTKDGGLDEDVAALVRTSSELSPGAYLRVASAEIALDPAKMRGSFRVTHPEWSVGTSMWQLNLYENGASGTLYATAQERGVDHPWCSPIATMEVNRPVP